MGFYKYMAGMVIDENILFEKTLKRDRTLSDQCSYMSFQTSAEEEQIYV